MEPPPAPPPEPDPNDGAPRYGRFTPPPIGSFDPAARPPTREPPGEAIAALICGLLAWSCFPLGIVALWLGAKARKLAAERPDTVGGEGMALAGMILGGALGALQIIIYLLYFGMVAAMLHSGP